MAGTTRILLAAFLVISLGYRAEGWWWGWEWDWSETRPSDCPFENHQTHVCGSLSEAEGMCVNIRCCNEEDSAEDEYQHGMEEGANGVTWEPDTGGSHHRSRHRHGGCRLCVSVNISCTVYKCHRYCCAGYTYDRQNSMCVNQTSMIDCQNGGTPFETWGRWTCLCPKNFTGEHCETPVCHCQNGGQCRNGWNGQTYCQCRQGYTGPNCSEPVCDIRCRNGGKCVRDGDAQSCLCPANYVGKYCEDYHVNDKRCPATDMWWYPPDCFDECNGYRDCPGNQLCCKEGCSRVCRHPTDETCYQDGRSYRAGAKVPRDDPCMDCTCTASGDIECATTMCAACRGNVLHEASHERCCPVCEDNPDIRPPRFENCPSWPVNVTVDRGSHEASLEQLADRLKATDQNGRPAKVTISPSSVSHCACTKAKNTYHQVVATAVVKEGISSTCTFKVYVLDREPPRFHSCPDDIFVFEDEVVTWEEPRYSDNVGVYYRKCNKGNKDKTYPLGVHNITYTVVDYEYNFAVCDFQINVTKRGTDFNDMPKGMKQRATGKHVHIAIIVAPVIGLLIIIISLVFMFFLCRRRHFARSARRPPTARGQNYDNNIYAVCGPPDSIKGMKLPQYTLPSNPPAYSPDMMNEGEYAYIAPPSYTEEDPKKNVYDNPGYEAVTPETITTETVTQETVTNDNDKAE